MRISDWSSDVCSSDLLRLVDDGADMAALGHRVAHLRAVEHRLDDADRLALAALVDEDAGRGDTALAGVDEHALPRRRRSEERRVGKEGVSTCRSRWSPYH